MRVVGGRLRGRALAAPESRAIRPTSERLRESIFDILEHRYPGRIEGRRIVDLFAGSGALAIEALSRGATRALLVERDRAALDAIDQNLDHLALGDRARVQRADVAAVVAGPPPREAPFHLVIADPPYDTEDAAITGLLAALTAPGWLAPDAMIVVERPAHAEIGVPDGLRACWERTFGDTLVFFVDASDPPI